MAYKGLTMNFTDSQGVNHPNSFWCTNHITLDPRNRVATFTMNLYHDMACCDAGKSEYPTEVKRFCVEGDSYDTYFGDSYFDQSGGKTVGIPERCGDVALSLPDLNNNTDLKTATKVTD